MTSWNLADVMELNAELFPDHTAQIHGTSRTTWRAFDRRCDGVAHGLLEAGLSHQAKVAQYLYNCPEYMQSFFAACKAALVPVNTNYRYVDDELVYLWRNSDTEAVVFHSTFAERIAGLRRRVPGVRLWLCVSHDEQECPQWATPFEQVANSGQRARPPWKRRGDDLFLLYTGGTTGMPKGVMWRQDDIFHINNDNRPEPWNLSGGLQGLARQKLADDAVGRVSLPACPLMHGTGMLTAIAALSGAGCVVTLAQRNFDAMALLDTIERERVQAMAIVGDAFARPLVQALDAEPGRWDISSLELIVSSGVMWSRETKQGLLRHHPGLVLRDSLGSSESIGMGRSESTANNASQTARFQLGEHTTVIDDEGSVVPPGSGRRGRLAVAGRIPVGYFKDPIKSAQTFVEISGRRYAVAGDYAAVRSDGTIDLLGRGSVCINTGGEKVFPEEVEEVLKRHPAVRDAVCVGVPSVRFGEMIAAIVELAEARETAREALGDAELIAHVKQHLAPYKAPRAILRRPIGRAPNGKADYPGLREHAIALLRDSE